MQILMDGNYQRTLRLTDEATASLNGFQVWLILAAGLINGMCATVVLLLRQSSRLHGVDRALGHAQLGILFATLSLLLYAYLFSMYKQQSSQIVGPGFTSNQDIVASLGVGLCLLLLFLSIDEKFSAAVIPTIAGIVAVVAEIAGAPKLSIFRTLFGWETKVSTQLVLICAVVILGVICVYAVRPQSALAR
jgi:hypothetical protein